MADGKVFELWYLFCKKVDDTIDLISINASEESVRQAIPTVSSTESGWHYGYYWVQMASIEASPELAVKAEQKSLGTRLRECAFSTERLSASELQKQLLKLADGIDKIEGGQ